MCYQKDVVMIAFKGTGSPFYFSFASDIDSTRVSGWVLKSVAADRQQVSWMHGRRLCEVKDFIGRVNQDSSWKPCRTVAGNRLGAVATLRGFGRWSYSAHAAPEPFG